MDIDNGLDDVYIARLNQFITWEMRNPVEAGEYSFVDYSNLPDVVLEVWEDSGFKTAEKTPVWEVFLNIHAELSNGRDMAPNMPLWAPPEAYERALDSDIDERNIIALTMGPVIRALRKDRNPLHVKKAMEELRESMVISWGIATEKGTSMKHEILHTLQGKDLEYLSKKFTQWYEHIQYLKLIAEKYFDEKKLAALREELQHEESTCASFMEEIRIVLEHAPQGILQEQPEEPPEYLLVNEPPEDVTEALQGRYTSAQILDIWKAVQNSMPAREAKFDVVEDADVEAKKEALLQQMTQIAIELGPVISVFLRRPRPEALIPLIQALGETFHQKLAQLRILSGRTLEMEDVEMVRKSAADKELVIEFLYNLAWYSFRYEPQGASKALQVSKVTRPLMLEMRGWENWAKKMCAEMEGEMSSAERSGVAQMVGRRAEEILLQGPMRKEKDTLPN